MQGSLLDITDDVVDYSDKKVMIPLSEGINSAAIVCLLGEHHPAPMMPKELHLFDVHLVEHSPDSLQFAWALIQYAHRKFPYVTATIVQDSFDKWCLDNKMVPHPSISPCSRELKMNRLDEYFTKQQLDIRLIGYVRHEMKRWTKAQKHIDSTYRYPILSLTDEDCFEIVKKAIGWYPAIYDITFTQEDLISGLCRKFELGRRVFKHNNCLDCKNLTTRQVKHVRKHFPLVAERADLIATSLPGARWGRDDVPEVMKCDACDRM